VNNGDVVTLRYFDSVRDALLNTALANLSFVLLTNKRACIVRRPMCVCVCACV